MEVTMKKIPRPSHRERVALFRLSIIGDLLSRELRPGELKTELEERSRHRYRPPGSSGTRQYHFKTLQRWYSAEYMIMRSDGGKALEPATERA